MEKETIRRNRESGQTVVLFALAVIGLVAFVGLAVDGGNVFNERRIVQNGADASALRGAHYIASSDAPEETTLCATVNEIVEGNGVPDSDGVAGNAINDNVQIVYTDESGNQAPVVGPQVNCHSPRDAIPQPAQGVEVSVDSRTDTFFLGIVGLDTLPVGGRAVAVIKGAGGTAGDLGENALLAFGEECQAEDGPMDMSGYFVDVIGGVHSNTHFVNRGSENHYHGSVTYVDGYTDPADIPGVYGSGPDQTDDVLADPFAGLFTVDDFACDRSIGSNYTCYDLTTIVESNPTRYKGTVSAKLLRENDPGDGVPYLDPDTGKLRDGIYYAGDYPFDFGFDLPPGEVIGLNGEVTLVSSNYIKITEDNVQLTGYMPEGSVLPDLLMFSSLDPWTRYGVDPCTNFEDLMPNEEWLPINTTGNAATVPPKVWHDVHDGVDCDVVLESEDASSCYQRGSLWYDGILYAPYGRIATSGHGATYIGALVAHTIRVNGFIEYCDWYGPAPCRPELNERYDGEPYPGPFVGALFVYDYQAGDTTEARIYLEE